MEKKCIYLSFEQLAAEAFIALNPVDEDKIVNKLSRKYILEYGIYLSEKIKEKFPGATVLCSEGLMGYYANIFQELENRNIQLSNATSNSLIDKFHTYISSDILKIFLESHEYLQKKYDETEIKSDCNSEIIHLDLKDMACNLLIEINSLGEENKVDRLPIDFVSEYAEIFIEKFNRKYIVSNKKIILEHPKFLNSATGFKLSDLTLDVLITRHRRKDISQDFIREIRSDSLKICDMYNEYIYNKNGIKKERKF